MHMIPLLAVPRLQTVFPLTKWEQEGLVGEILSLFYAKSIGVFSMFSYLLPSCFFQLYYYFFTHLEDVNVSALITGITCAILLYILKYLNQRYQFKFPIPAELIVVRTHISYNFVEK